MNVDYATWILDNGSYRGIVVSSKTFDTMRTANTFSTPEAAVAAARALIDWMAAAVDWMAAA